MANICIVGDSRAKLKTRALAENMFTAPLFKKARAYARSHSNYWYILSARYGLLKPGDLIDPYSITVDDLSDDDLFKLAQRVVQRLYRTPVTSNDHFTMLAKSTYCKVLAPVLAARSYSFSYPLAGKGIVQQLRWLKAHST